MTVHSDLDADRQRIRAAWLYYVENRTQSEVAGLLGVGRVTVVRMLAEARRRGEVRVTIEAPLANAVALERGLEARYGLTRAKVAPLTDPDADPTPVVAAAAGPVIAEAMRPGVTVGVGWGRTLDATLPHIAGRPLDSVRVISLLGGIAEARRFNPAQFAWAFAELFGAEGYLVPAPALVDTAATKEALLTRCGIADIFAMTAEVDVAILSVGGVSADTTSYRTGHLTEADRQSLLEAGAVGDCLYHFLDGQGRTVDHPVNGRAVAVELDQLRRVPERLMISGGPEKVAILRAALTRLSPTQMVTDEATARCLLDD